MCVAVPARVVETHGSTAKVDFGGVRREIGIDLVPGVRPGQFVLVHAGFAIQTIDVEEAEQQLQFLREVLRSADGAEGDEDQHDNA